MKHQIFKAILIFASVAGMAGLSSCNNKPEDAKEVSEDINEEKFETNKSEKDAQFLVEAADINLMEVDMGKMASKATMQEVKDFGNKMENEHRKAFDQLMALAASKNVTIPSTVSDEGMKHHEKLNDKSGYDFDREFLDKMIDGHETAIKKFEDASQNCTDEDIKAWAAKMLPDLNAHLAEAKVLKEKVKDMK